MPTFALRRTSKRTAVKQRVVQWIRQQGLRQGERILSQNQLASALDTTPVTVHKALTELCEEGLLYRRRGAGTFVGQAPRPNRVKRMCLVLHEAGLDQPQHNPDYWCYVQTLLRGFIQAGGAQWSFGTHVVEDDHDPAAIAPQFADYDAVFFHYAQYSLPLIQHLVRHRVAPVIKLGQPQREAPCLTVDHDKPAGIEKAIDHLFTLGHRRIGLIAADADWGRFAVQPYHQTLKAYGLPIDPARIIRTGPGRRDGYRAAALLVERGLPCDALVVDMDLRALGVIDGLRDLGVRVPEDVSVVGYDGLDTAVHQPPHLTTIVIPYQQMIAAALDEADQAVARQTPVKHLSLAGTLLTGMTTARRA